MSAIDGQVDMEAECPIWHDKQRWAGRFDLLCVKLLIFKKNLQTIEQVFVAPLFVKIFFEIKTFALVGANLQTNVA
jgi:hypothetical protein